MALLGTLTVFGLGFALFSSHDTNESTKKPKAAITENANQEEDDDIDYEEMEESEDNFDDIREDIDPEMLNHPETQVTRGTDGGIESFFVSKWQLSSEIDVQYNFVIPALEDESSTYRNLALDILVALSHERKHQTEMRSVLSNSKFLQPLCRKKGVLPYLTRILKESEDFDEVKKYH